MLFKNVTYLNENLEIVRNGYIGVTDDKISYVSTEVPMKDFGEEVDATGKIMLPGLINTHCHVPMTLLRGYAENLSLQDWLTTKIFPFEAKLNEEAVYWGSLLGIAEMIKCGVTSFSDMYMFCEGIGHAVIESGIKCNMSQVITCNKNTSLTSLECFRQTEKLFETFKDNTRLKIDTSLHAEYSTTPEIVKEMAEFSKGKGCVLQIHVSETLQEHNDCKLRHKGKTPIEYFAEHQVFHNNVVLAHCVHIEENDINILVENNASVAHCPTSNMKLGSGIAPIYRMLKSGVNVTIGTDGAASNNNLNIMEEMHLAALLQKGFHRNPTIISPADILKISTVNGAKAQNRSNTGIIKNGYQADLILIDFKVPHLQPIHDELASITYSAQASDICMTMVDGKVLYKDGELLTLDLEKIIYKVQENIARLNKK